MDVTSEPLGAFGRGRQGHDDALGVDVQVVVHEHVAKSADALAVALCHYYTQKRLT